MLSEFLFLEEDATKDEKSNYLALKVELRQMLNDNFNRRILTQVLLDLRKDISGSTQDLICQLYQNLGLENDSFKKLKSWRWQQICKGIIELSQMKVSNAYSILCKYVNSPRSIIRKQAEIAIVTLNDEGIAYLLDNTKSKISEWQQLKLLEVLATKNDFQVPLFKVWLTSNNNHVVLFALRLIKHYNQNDSRASVIELVRHKSNQIREAAILCIKEFNFYEAIDTMKMVFWNCSISVKISILDALSEIGSEAELEFLKLIETKEANFLVRSKAVSCINSICPDHIMPYKDIHEVKHFNVPKDISLSEDQLQVGETELFKDISTYQKVHLATKNTSENKPTILKNEMHEKTDKRITETSTQETLSDFMALNFLPIIVENKNEKPVESFEKDKLQQELDILKIKVNYDLVDYKSDSTVEQEKNEAKSTTKNEEFELSEIHFLPLVVENETKDANKNELLDIEVQYDSVIPTKKSSNTVHELLNIEVDFRIFEALLKSETPENLTANAIKNIQINYEEIKVTNDVGINQIADIEVIAERVNPVESIETENDATLTFEPNDRPEDTNLLDKEEFNLEDLVDFNFPTASLPKNYKSTIEFDTETSFFLENIAELGDEREIPYLNELKHDDEYYVFIDQIELLIKKLNKVSTQNKTEEILKPFNVFENLFQHCDLESKLILLDEVYAIGDLKDIDFLRELITVEKGELQEKAMYVLNHLESKWQPAEKPTEPQTNLDLDEIMMDFEIESSKSENIFDLNFEPFIELESVVQEEVLSNSENNMFNSFLRQLNIFSSKKEVR